jgi:hypothetical protein
MRVFARTVRQGAIKKERALAKMEADRPLIFISYATPDRDRVLPFFDHLTSLGFIKPWMDVRCLKPGQNWDFEIKKALNKASVILIFISNNSCDRRGYVQRELRLALDKLNEKLIEDIFVIPVLLDDDTPIPEQIKGIHFTKASQGNCNAEIEDAIRHQLTRLGEKIQEAQKQSNVEWTSSIYRDTLNGAPGYEAEFQLLRFSSSDYPKVSEVTDVIRGILLSEVMNTRLVMLEPPADTYNFGQRKWRRINTYEARCRNPTIVGNVLSVQYNIDVYNAGGAHSCLEYKTFCYLLEPTVPINSLRQLFTEPERAFSVIQPLIRKQLLEPKKSTDDETFSVEWVHRGTECWEDFSSFVFDETGIIVLFAPYKVDCYGAGPKSTKVEYSTIVRLKRAGHRADSGATEVGRSGFNPHLTKPVRMTSCCCRG